MQWYYAKGKEPVGPFSEKTFHSLVHEGTITPATLVWHEGMANWKAYGLINQENQEIDQATVELDAAEVEEVPAPGTAPCSHCGFAYSPEEMIRYGDAWVCSRCKPLFIQKFKEEMSVTSALNYAGFWVRVGAKFIDGIILWLISMLFTLGAGLIAAPYADPYQTMAIRVFLALVQITIAASYTTWFLGKFDATPGKMAFHLLVVNPDGTSIGYGRALGRHFAEWISGLLVGIGYLMVAFDPEKRSLHDRICSTRVIRK